MRGKAEADATEAQAGSGEGPLRVLGMSCLILLSFVNWKAENILFQAEIDVDCRQGRYKV